jgi:large subunit ribosomal protein L13
LSIETETIYLDAEGQIAGRFCSRVAKLLVKGSKVVVVNSEKALISGGRASVFLEWSKKLELSSRVNPLYGPIHYRRPDNILRRMVRGMVPHQRSKGRLAMKRLRVYLGTPEAFSGKKFGKPEGTTASRPTPLYTSLEELGRHLGWRE